MRYQQDPSQTELFDFYEQILSPVAYERLQRGWQHLFRTVILNLMPVESLAKHFDPTIGRPTKELYSIAALIFVMEFRNWTHQEAADAYMFNVDLQYALNLRPENQSLCRRTIERYIEHFRDDQIAAQIMNDVTAELVRHLELDVSKQRLDSTHIESNMAKFGRIKLMATAIKRFLVQVKRHDEGSYNALRKTIRQRYEANANSLFGWKKLDNDQVDKLRQSVAEDLLYLVERYRRNRKHHDRSTYKAMAEILSQQCDVDVGKVTLKEKTGGDVICNSSDVDATYDGHKGSGYQVQLSETYSHENNVQLILAAHVETAFEWQAQPLFQITLSSDQMQVDVLNLGAVLQRISWAGQDHNLCLGYPTVDPYLINPGKLGAIVGRYANRINQAQAMIDGVSYKFDANNGAHCLHGGRETLGLRASDVLEYSRSHVVLLQRMPDGHMGFPGALDVWVTYRLQGATLGVDIRAKTDAPTLCNITGHAYFNFTGAPTIADHQLQVAASQILQVDETGIPSGEKMNVAGTQFDFQTPAALRQGDHPVMIDHNYCVSDDRTALRPIAWLSGGDTQMELASTEPGLQIYTGAGLGADLPSAPRGRAFHPYAGIALEPQIWPDSPNHPKFAQAILRPNDEYHHQIEYRFTRC